MAQHRFVVPPEEALSTLADASGALSALFAIDAHIEQHTEWLKRVATAQGMTPQGEEEESKNARAKANVQMEQTRALRRDLADLAADAEAVLPPNVSRRNDIVREPVLPSLPERTGPLELRALQRRFAKGLAAHMRSATGAMRPLRDRLRRSDDPESTDLAERLHDFITGVHGPERA